MYILTETYTRFIKMPLLDCKKKLQEVKMLVITNYKLYL